MCSANEWLVGNQRSTWQLWFRCSHEEVLCELGSIARRAQKATQTDKAAFRDRTLYMMDRASFERPFPDVPFTVVELSQLHVYI